MSLYIDDKYIPGTILKKSDMGNVTGKDFLSKIFYISSGVMMSQIKEISGIETSTLQNWVKRGWVSNAKQKKYDINQLANILIINMLRSCMQLEKISFIMKYINGEANKEDDNIVSYSDLYHYICKTLEHLSYESEENGLSIRDYIAEEISDYEEKFSGSRKRLSNAIEIIVISYYANMLKRYVDNTITEFMKK